MAGADPEQAPKPEQVEGFLKKSGMGMFRPRDP